MCLCGELQEPSLYFTLLVGNIIHVWVKGKKAIILLLPTQLMLLTPTAASGATFLFIDNSTMYFIVQS